MQTMLCFIYCENVGWYFLFLGIGGKLTKMYNKTLQMSGKSGKSNAHEKGSNEFLTFHATSEMLFA